ncbi:MAG TPA: hypothetical protein VGR22_07470 [Thermomicrobiales bacterium]|nr:hypothetical protein [Thermomicrobiales bacterium]
MVSRQAGLSEAALLPSGLLSRLATDIEATPVGTPAPGDGTGGVVLLPVESTAILEIGPPNRTPTPDAD